MRQRRHRHSGVAMINSLVNSMQIQLG